MNGTSNATADPPLAGTIPKPVLAAGARFGAYKIEGPTPADWFSFGSGFYVSDESGNLAVAVLLNSAYVRRGLPAGSLIVPAGFATGTWGCLETLTSRIDYVVFAAAANWQSFLPDATAGLRPFIKAWLDVVRLYDRLTRNGIETALIDGRDIFVCGDGIIVASFEIQPVGMDQSNSLSFLATAIANTFEPRASLQPPSINTTALRNAILQLRALAASVPTASQITTVLRRQLPLGDRMIDVFRSWRQSSAGPRCPWPGSRQASSRPVTVWLRPLLEHPYPIFLIASMVIAFLIGLLITKWIGIAIGLIAGWFIREIARWCRIHLQRRRSAQVDPAITPEPITATLTAKIKSGA